MSRRRLPPPLTEPTGSPANSTNEERMTSMRLPPRPPSHPLSRTQGASDQSISARRDLDPFPANASAVLNKSSDSAHATRERPDLDVPVDRVTSPSRTNDITMPGIVIDLDAGSPPLTPTIEDLVEEEEELTEQELRALYDEEEMNRFLNMFSAYVREVRSVEIVKENLAPDAKQELDPLRPAGPTEKRILEGVELSDDEWASLDDPPRVDNPPSTPTSAPGMDDPLSKRVVQYILPYLPPPGAPPPRFTLGRMQEVAQRLFLAIEPTYRPFALHLFKLATWQDWNTSCFWCCVYWLLWLQDLVLPSLILRVLWSLVVRRLRPYPTLAQLRERRKEIAKAEEFGDGIAARITKTSKFGVRDAWKVWQDFRSLSDLNVAEERSSAPPPEESMADIRMTEAVLNDTPSEQTMLMLALLTLNGVADMHERVRNVFLWRKPAASRRYGMVLFIGFLVTLLIPARYLAKMVYFAAGFAFWHVSPVLDALSASGRSRMPPPLYDVPTDTDYAMQLMADRVAKGHSLKPTKPRRKLRQAIDRKSGKLQETLRSHRTGDSVESLNTIESPTRRARWVKNAVTVAKTSAVIAQEGYGLAMKLRAQARSDGVDSLDIPEETNSFFVQHSTGPGLMTLSATSLSFTLATGAKKFTILRSTIHGVKKSNALGVKGLAVRWMDAGDVECTEKFHWVKNRDEAFARLVAGADRQWRRV